MTPLKSWLIERVKELETENLDLLRQLADALAKQCQCRRPEPVNNNVVRAPRKVVEVNTEADLGLQ